MKPLSVLLDAGPAVHQAAGLSRYTEQLAVNLRAHERERVDLRLFFNYHSGHTLPASLDDTPFRAVPMGQYRWRINTLASHLMRTWMATVLGTKHPALYHATEHLLPRVAVPTVLTVHDLIFERFPEHHTRRNRLFLKLSMPTFVRAADALIAVSHQTRRDLIELYHTPPEKITVIHQGIDTRFRPASVDAVQRVRQEYGLAGPYLLMVGTLEPRKNHGVAMEALVRLRAAGHDVMLVIAGGKGWKFAPIRERVAALELTDRVIFTGFVPDVDLPALYAGASCLLSPSLYEGFGFPILEAMACDTPVICSDVGSLPEVAGDAALFVSATDADALAGATIRLLTEPGLATSMAAVGRAPSRTI